MAQLRKVQQKCGHQVDNQSEFDSQLRGINNYIFISHLTSDMGLSIEIQGGKKSKFMIPPRVGTLHRYRVP